MRTNGLRGQDAKDWDVATDARYAALLRLGA